MTERLTVARLGHLGDGVTPGPVFVPLSLPGEVVEGEVVDGRMAGPRIVTPSPNRVRPPCPHFKSCGGCAVQHASDAFIADWKAGQVRAALAAQGLNAPIETVETSPPQSRRRAVLSGRRTKKGAIVGFHARASDAIIEIPDCQLLLPQIGALLPALRELVRIGASRKAEPSLNVTWSDAGADIAVTGGKPLDGPFLAELGAFAQRHRIARLAWDAEMIAELQPPVQRFGEIPVIPPPGAFLQATEHGQHVLTREVLRAVGPTRRIADLFAGCGTFGLPLARQAEVHAVEADPDMLSALDAAWRRADGLKRVTTETRDLFRRPLLAQELHGFDAVVIDPPRAGAEAQMRQIAASPLRLVAAVSCHPGSFASDARILVEAGFRLDWIVVVDQFRWSPHVELAARFVRDHIDAGAR